MYKRQISARVKHIYSIYRKMYAQHKTINEIYDICAVRVIVDTVADCYNVLGYVHDLYKPIPGRFKDYISTPKPNGYQSLHTTVIGRAGIPFEVQIRTVEMHKMAEYGVAAHWKYKQGLDKKGNEEAFAWIRQLLEAQQDTEAEDFIKNIKVDPVSYTHLDVYKRQRHGRAVCGQHHALDEARDGRDRAPPCATAVSYTQLAS